MRGSFEVRGAAAFLCVFNKEVLSIEIASKSSVVNLDSKFSRLVFVFVVVVVAVVVLVKKLENCSSTKDGT